MEKRKLLISDANEEFVSMLVKQLQGLYQIRTTSEGNETLETVRAFEPDIMVLEVMMPGLDGISILQTMAQNGYHPTVLAVTRFASDYVLEKLSDLGVGYLMMKPCNIRAMVDRIADLSRQSRAKVLVRQDPRTAASNLMLNLGFRTKLKGYGYLRDAIPMAMKNPGFSLTKELYPEVGRLWNVNSEQVERAIRGAVKSAWLQRDEQMWKIYFQPDGNGKVPRPTNGAFITRMAECILSGQEYEETPESENCRGEFSER